MRVERQTDGTQSETLKTVPFLEELAPELTLWLEAISNLQEINTGYFGKGGLVDGFSQEQFQFFIQVYTHHRGPPDEKIERIISKHIRAETISALLGKDSDQKIPSGIKGLSLPAVTMMTPEEKEGLKKFVIQMREYRDQFHQKIIRASNVRSQQETVITGKLSAWLSADFDNLLQLAMIAEQRTPLTNLLRFFSDGHLAVLRAAAQRIKQQELETPTPARLIAWLDQIALDFYQQGKNEKTWQIIEFLLPIPPGSIRTFYKEGADNGQRQQILFNPLIEHLQRFDKSLPPPIKELYATHLNKLQEAAIRKLEKVANQLRIGRQKLPTPESFEVSAEDQPETGQTPPPEPSKTEPPTERKNPPKDILINGQLCVDLESLKQQLTQLFQRDFKVPRKGDIDNYALIIAKVAGWKVNVLRGYDLKKLAKFPPVTFNDGSKGAVRRLKLTAASSPRVFLTEHKKTGTLVVLGAFDREDKTYSELIQKGGFGHIVLPFLGA